MVRSRPRALAMLVGALLLTLNACTATTTAGPAVTASAPGITTTGSPTSGAAPAGATSAGAATPASSPTAATPSVVIETATSETALFVTPSGNIGCGITATNARCDIGDRSWTAPPKPANCMLDYGNGVAVDATGAHVECAGDTLVHATTTVLAYGHGLRNGQFLCVSQSTGVRCDDETTGHGFTLAKEAYTLF